jgi:putative peptidoglycan lipid II flippase
MDPVSLSSPSTDESVVTPPRTGARGGIALAALILMFGNVVSRLLGLVREQIAAGLFGTGDEIAAFTVADNIQTLLFDLLASGALQAALIPVLAQWAAPDVTDRQELRRIGGTLVIGALVAVGSLVAIGMVFAPSVVDGLIWFSGDTGARGAETVDLTIRLVLIVLPAALLLSIATVLQAILYAIGRVTAPALSTAVRNAVIVVVAALFGSRWGVESMAWGTLGGAAAIVLIQIPPLMRANVLPAPAFIWRHPALRQMGALYIPVFLGLLVNSTAVIVDRGLAWGAGENAVGAMRYATTLVQLTLGLVAAAISLAALPTLSRHFQSGDTSAYRTTLGRALVMVTVLIFPATFGLAALAEPISSLLFGYGATGDDGLRSITFALLGYLPGTLAAAYDQVLIFAFYARQNTRLPVAIGVMAVLVYFAVALSLVDTFGMMGLVLANSAQFIAHTVVIWYFGRSRFGWMATPRLSFLIPRCAMAAAAGAGAGFFLWLGLSRIVPESAGVADIVWRIVLVAAPMALVAGIYLPWVARLCPAEVAMIRDAVRSRLPRR